MLDFSLFSAFALFAGVFLLPFVFFTVEQQTVAIVERFGRFTCIAGPGLNVKIPFIDRIVARLNLRVQQLDVYVETKTEDNVFVKLAVSVQYRVLEKSVYQAFYKLENPEQQVTAFVFDVVRARVPQMKLDDVFERKDDIANSVREELSDIMKEFGYDIVKTLVTDIDPNVKVKEAMNEINAALRQRMAASERAEAEKIMRVKQAEAEAESNRLHGEGLANQRKAIIEGLKESVADFQEAIDGTTAENVLNIVLLTQYFDTIKDLGAQGSHTILMPHSPGAVSDFAAQIRDSMVVSNEVSKASSVSTKS